MRPILRLNQASQAIAFGDLQQTVKDGNIQELNTLAYSFNHMAGHLSIDVLDEANANRTVQEIEANPVRLASAPQ